MPDFAVSKKRDRASYAACEISPKPVLQVFICQLRTCVAKELSALGEDVFLQARCGEVSDIVVTI